MKCALRASLCVTVLPCMCAFPCLPAKIAGIFQKPRGAFPCADQRSQSNRWRFFSFAFSAASRQTVVNESAGLQQPLFYPSTKFSVSWALSVAVWLRQHFFLHGGTANSAGNHAPGHGACNVHVLALGNASRCWANVSPAIRSYFRTP